ncbi:hypothetical protein EB118_13940 [bacterium]|nr:hypothetical protein [bacterium]
MFKKLKELFGFPTEQEKAAAKDEVKVENAPTTVATNVFPFPTGDKPEAEPKVKKPRVAKPKAEKAPVEKTPAAKKPAAKKPAAKKPAAKKPAAKKPATRKAKSPVVGSGDVNQS